MKKIFILIFSLISFQQLFAQTNFQIKQATQGKGLVYNTEKAVLIAGKTNGFALGYQWGELKTYYKTTFYRIDLGFLRHPKETRVNPNGATVPTANSYYYGKQNSFWQLRAGWGEKRYLSEKESIRGVAVGFSYCLGPTLGLLKPYYLERGGIEGNGFNVDRILVKYDPNNPSEFTDKNSINGAASFFTGVSETRLTPGGHANIGVHFDWGAFEDFVRSMEVGIATDIFLRKVPILVENSQNRLYFINLYLHLQLGKRK
jgi:hypothetical protein